MKWAFRFIFIAIIILEGLGAIGFLKFASDFTWLGLIVTLVGAWIALEVSESPTWLWWVTLAMVLMDGVSDLLLLYSRIGNWDRLMHALGGSVIAAWALQLALRSLSRGHVRVRRRVFYIIASVVGATVLGGFLYEALEYAVDRWHYDQPTTLVSAYDTVDDQLFNLLGAGIVLSGYYFIAQNFKRQKK